MKPVIVRSLDGETQHLWFKVGGYEQYALRRTVETLLGEPRVLEFCLN